jgi:hypothetical protein
MAGKLRHGLNYLWPSDIADQFYWEYKVHLKRIHRDVQIELPSLELGEANHTALVSQAEPITRTDVERSIREGKKLVICERELEGHFDGVRIRGRLDFFTSEGNNALLLLDFKFSAAQKPFPTHVVQAETYAFLTRRMGFVTDQLSFGIVLFPPAGLGSSLRDSTLTKTAMLQSFKDNGTLRKISEECEQARKALLAGRSKTTTIEADGWNAFLYRYSAKKVEKDLTWALGYWLGEREPEPEKYNCRKCSGCPFNAAGLCEYALDEPDPGLLVVRHPGGRITVSREFTPKLPD